MTVSRYRASNVLAMAAIAVVAVDFGEVLVGGVAGGDYAYDSVGDVLFSGLFLLVFAGGAVAPVLVCRWVLRREPERPFPASWAPVGGQAAALVVIVGMVLGIRASDSSTAALGYVVLPFYAGGAACALYWVLRVLGQVRSRA